jgi:predicted MPP superfamily phosphohydrolase
LTSPSTTRRRFLKIAAAAGALAIGTDATVFEPNQPRLVRVDIPLRRLPREFDGFTIIQLSDFHFDPYFSVIPIRKSVHMSNQLNPDLVVLTGDYVTVPAIPNQERNRQAARLVEPCSEVLHALRARHGVWSVLGNHDTFSDPAYITGSLSDAGIRTLSNDAVPIERNGRRFWLAGIGDVLGHRADLNLALKGISPAEPVVLLVHEPDFADHVAKYPVDLQLSGHSHGGQVRLPLIGALYLPSLAKKYPKGLRSIDGLMLYTNVGIGTLYIPVRWNCAPEVTQITLRSMPPA